MVVAGARLTSSGLSVDDADWSVIVPYHNERRCLGATIASLAAQHVRPRLILVDNASSDHSAEVARETCEQLGIDALHLFEQRPGKVAALQCGLREVTTRFVATCDADTIYPAGYLALAGRLLDQPDAVAAIAANCALAAPSRTARLAGLRLALTARLLPQQCLNGGASQVFRTSALRTAGGFDPAIWNWVLEDHEVIARIEQSGRIVYHRDFICHPAARPRQVDCTGWTLGEQLRYHATSARARRSFFHDLLAPRLRARALSSETLRRAAPVLSGA